MKPRLCAYEPCGKTFIPLRMGQKVCGPACANKWVRAEKARGKKTLRERKAALKTSRELEQECRVIVQKYARVRDRDDGCISCDKPANWPGQWHGSHFRSVGACSALSLHLWNVHKACSVCNHHKSGNIAEYEPRLIRKIGADRVDWMKSQNQIVRRTRQYLERFKKVMGKRLRRLEKTNELRRKHEAIESHG